MKKNILYIALLGFMSLMTVSCNSELDIEKHGNMLPHHSTSRCAATTTTGSS